MHQSVIRLRAIDLTDTFSMENFLNILLENMAIHIAKRVEVVQKLLNIMHMFS